MNPIFLKNRVLRQDRIDSLYQFLISNYDDNSNSIYFKYGYEIMGPLLFSMCTWIQEQLELRNIRKVYFCARDGYLIQKSYKEIFQSESLQNYYFYISRQTAHIASYNKNSTLDDILALSAPAKRWEFRTFIGELGLEDSKETKHIWNDCGLSYDEVFTSRQAVEDKRVLNFFERQRDSILISSNNCRNLLVRYMQEIEFNGNVAIVDIGWNATTQKCLKEIVKQEAINTNIFGLYLGLNVGALSKDDGDAFLPLKIRINDAAFGLVEYPFLAPEGSLQRYSLSSNDEIEMKLHEYEFAGQKEIIDNTQEGCLSFVRHAKNNKFKLSKMAAYSNFVRIVKTPTLREAKILGNVLFYDTKIHKIASPKPFSHYIFHPSVFKRDFNDSTWKMGFLKQVFIVPINYYLIVFFLKRITKRGQG